MDDKEQRSVVAGEIRKQEVAHEMTPDDVVAALSNRQTLVARATYYQYRDGKRGVPQRVLVVLAQIFGCTTDTLLGLGGRRRVRKK